MNVEKLFNRYDILDDMGENNNNIETVTEMKTWLKDHWTDYPDSRWNDEDLEEFCRDVDKADLNELDQMLGGIGYSFVDEKEERIFL